MTRNDDTKLSSMWIESKRASGNPIKKIFFKKSKNYFVMCYFSLDQNITVV